MFYPAWRELAFVSSGWALLGPRGQDASGFIAGIRREIFETTLVEPS